MKVKAKSLFSNSERRMIREAVETAEKTTMGEIAIMVVDESDRYREAELAGALFFSCLLALVIAIILRHTTIWFFAPVAAALSLPFFLLIRRLPVLKLAFLGRGRMEEAVRQRAVLGFLEKGIHRTEEQTGILLFISLLERKVWILGDKGIDSKIESEVWTALAAELSAGIREGRASEALCRIIEKCGAELTRHFPGRQGQRNELCDDVIC
jgi:putative membrane protein